MKQSTVLVEIDLGIVIDETQITLEEVLATLSSVDLNLTSPKMLAHLFKDIDTGEIVELIDLQTGLKMFESHRYGDYSCYGDKS